MDDSLVRLSALCQEITTTLASDSRVTKLETELAKARAKNKALESKLDKVCKVMISILNEDEPSADVVTGEVVNEDSLVDEEEVIRCIPCNKKFSAPRYLKRHNNKMHRGTAETSSSSSSSDEERLVVRNYTRRTGQTYTCSKSSKHYSVLSSLKRHVHQKHR
jgi:hypothetical protein